MSLASRVFRDANDIFRGFLSVFPQISGFFSLSVHLYRPGGYLLIRLLLRASGKSYLMVELPLRGPGRSSLKGVKISERPGGSSVRKEKSADAAEDPP